MRNYFILLFVMLNMIACGQEVKTPGDQKAKNINTQDSNSVKKMKTEEEWKKELSPEQYYILREKGTERPFTGKYLNHRESGTYICAACRNPLFDSDTKFDSHCGWPSFYAEKAKGQIVYVKDTSFGMIRTEIQCAKCGGHLGHVFDDGPEPTGLRYCVNSVSIEFIKKEE